MFYKKKIFLLLIFILLLSCSSITKKSSGIDPFDEINSNDLQNNQEDNKLLVGMLLPLSGNAEKIGNSLLRGAEMSMFDNKLNNIKILSYDTKGTAFGAIEAINSAIRDGVDIILGPFFTEETKAILNIAETNNLILISFSDNESLLNEKHSNLYLFGFTPKQEIDRIISYFIDYKNFYGFSAIFPNNQYGSIVSNSFKEVLFRKDSKLMKTDFYFKNDKKLKEKVDGILNTIIFRDEIYDKYEEEKKLAKSNGIKEEDIKFKYEENDKLYTEALLIPDSGEDVIKIGEYCKKNTSSKKPILIGTSKWLNNNLYRNKNFNNSYFVAVNPSQYYVFDDKYFDIYQTYPLRISTLAYDAITAIMESYAKAQNKKDIKLALENFQGFEGINGVYRFLNTGIVERKLAIIKIINGKYEIVNYNDEPFLKY